MSLLTSYSWDMTIANKYGKKATTLEQKNFQNLW